MRRYLLKVNGEVHCPNGVCRPNSAADWEGGEVLIPARGPLLVAPGRSNHAPPIEPGDELWIWTHEDDAHGRGWGLTAKARASETTERDGFLAVRLDAVERLPRPFGFRDLGEGPTGSRLLDHASAHRHHQAYLIEDSDHADFLDLVELRSGPLPDEVQERYASSNWDKEILRHKDDLLAGLADRKLTAQKARSGQQGFRAALFDRYGGACVVTRCAVPEALEAAHVMPHTGDPVWDRPENGLLLRRDLHSLFDAFLWSIHPKTANLHVSKKLRSHGYSKLHGRVIKHHVPVELIRFHFRQFERSEERIGQGIQDKV